MKTAMQGLKAHIQNMVDNGGDMDLLCVIGLIDSKFISEEKEQIINACIKTTKYCWISSAEYLGLKLEFKEQDLKDQKNEAEQYYNETFNNYEKP